MAVSTDLVTGANLLLQEAMGNYDGVYGLGAMSCAAYDTAWVSMVTRVIEGETKWVFPECFQYILDTQMEDGGWSIHGEVPIDSILNTAAPLLALKRHAANPLQLQHDPSEIAVRIKKATEYLQARLATWDVSSTDHVGFEIIVPAMLTFLEQEDPAVTFHFKSKGSLLRIRDAKMARFRPEFLYGERRTTVLHSLEALIGVIDFDRVAHHKVNGSMLGSPSSTAAYLMHSSVWDEEAEAYIRHVVQYASGKGSGGVPSAFPSTHFECSWILSTLLRSGFTASELQSKELEKMTEILSSSLEAEKGILGFAPFFEPDVDDTAKTITSLAILGQPVSADSMVEAFETDTHFRTYAGERDPSFTANCNALLALLHLPNASEYYKQIYTISKFLCDYWWNNDDRIKDKWNTCYLYPSILLVEAFMDLLALIETGQFSGVFEEELLYKIAIDLVQGCIRPLLDQQSNGSWNDSVEETAYGVLILCEARRFHFFDSLREPLANGIERGVGFLNSHRTDAPSFVWIEKVSYASPLLTKSYVLAALRASELPPPTPSVGAELLGKVSLEKMERHYTNLSQTPTSKSKPLWQLWASTIESAFYVPLLRRCRSAMFERRGVGKDNYFNMVPMTYVVPNNHRRTFLSASWSFETALLAIWIFHMDEFMEGFANQAFRGRMDDLRQIIKDLTSETTNGAQRSKHTLQENGTNGTNDTHHPNGTNGTTNGNRSLKDNHEDPLYVQAWQDIEECITWLFEHPFVKASSAWDQRVFRIETRMWLLGHVQQCEDSIRFQLEESNFAKQSSVADGTLQRWVRSTSSDHSSGPMGWAWMSCFIGSTLSNGKECWPTGTEKYIVEALSRHSSTACRIFNDFGSAQRDWDEGNLNCLDFPEFGPRGDSDETARKEMLRSIGKFESFCQQMSLDQLHIHTRAMTAEKGDAEEMRLAERRLEIVTMFCTQVEVYNEVYELRDCSSTMVKNEKGRENKST